MQKGNPFGAHRVIEPVGVLPQPAKKINNDFSLIYDNEILVDVEILNIDSASFTQIKEQAENNSEKIKEIILNIVEEKGKMQNPVTGSGGMFIGKVKKIGNLLKNKIKLKEGDKIASLVSLSLTPLKIEKIIEVKKQIDQVIVKAQAILFESGIYSVLPDDIPASLALAVLDVCGAPAQTARFVKLNNTVVIIGAGGKSGVLCAYEARKRVGRNGKIIGIEYSDNNIENLKKLGICDVILKLNACDALLCYEEISKYTNGELADVVINSVNIENTEMASIMMCKDKGLVYFFSMATSFTKAALGAEGVGKDVDMIVGNGYTKGHADLTLDIVRESSQIRELYERLYV
ncbi:MAG: L-erythro-3,5-diaminohexanoate dehydrogenase [Candidatus Muirbacterium halophilum]|nr:L-erythro-3,5-diaminohexanoate dehydrogenase [Candidatus Muirbacterium halophilum]MCK9475141.1 L-erythro-3,5-diaminohexanoate dehydrogenase [Candidatus Muirbacterium halophilum]